MSSETASSSLPSHRSYGLMLAIAMGLPTLGTWLYFVLLAGHPAMQAAYAASKVAQFSLPLAWVLLVERRRMRIARPNLAGLVPGLFFGSTVTTAMLVAYFGFLQSTALATDAAALIQTKLSGAGITSPGRYLALAIFYCALHSLAEEYYWRWFVFGQLRRFSPLPLAIALSSLAFAAHHVLVVAAYFDNPLVIGFLSISTAIGGAFWAWLYHRTESLYAPWLSHLLVDAGIMIVGYDLVWGLAP